MSSKFCNYVTCDYATYIILTSGSSYLFLFVRLFVEHIRGSRENINDSDVNAALDNEFAIWFRSYVSIYIYLINISYILLLFSLINVVMYVL